MSDSAKFSFACFALATISSAASMALGYEPLFWVSLVLIVCGLISWPD